MAPTPLTIDEISRTILERMTSNHGGSLAEAIDDDTETDAPPVGYSCAECGVQDAYNYVVTILDHEDIRHTRTEVCIPCAVTVSAESVDKIIAGLLAH